MGQSQTLEFDDIATKLSFKTIGGLSISMAISPDLKGVQFSDKTDIIFVPITNPPATFSRSDFFSLASEVTVWEPLYIFSDNPYLRALREYDNPSSPARPLNSISVELWNSRAGFTPLFPTAFTIIVRTSMGCQAVRSSR